MPQRPPAPPIPSLFEGLLWTKLLLATRLALHPGRIGIALIAIVAIALTSRIPELWLPKGNSPAQEVADRAPPAMVRIADGVLALDHVDLSKGLSELFVRIPTDVYRDFPWSTILIAPLILALWSIAGGAIARTAASEVALGRRMGWGEGVAFALSRPIALFSSMLAPLVIVLLVGVLLAAFGAALFSLQWIQVVGAALFFIPLLLSLVAILSLAGFVLGMPMLPAAVVCEGTDAIDALQRVYAYVLDRPVRVLLYSFVLLAQLAILGVVLAFLAKGVLEFAAWSSTLWTTPNARDAVQTLAANQPWSPPRPDSPTSLRAFAHVVGFWAAIPGLLVLAILVSAYFSGASLLYLTMRQVADGQDFSDLWSPGMIPGTQAPAERADDHPDGDDFA